MSLAPAELWDFAKQLISDEGSDWEAVLDPIGLLYADNSLCYDATPTNCEVFATTGGDGVHFGVLDAPGNPVVMVVRMMFERAHAIVGGNLHEFLCLGCKCGYFGLEQLVYDWPDTIEWIKNFDASTQGQTEAELLQAILQRFDLELILDPNKRLVELHREYRDKIIMTSAD